MSCSSVSTDPQETSNEKWLMVWSDEFAGEQIDQSKWDYDIGTGSNGWGNNELQYYTDRTDNVYLSEGKLVIQAIKEKSPYQDCDYTSARVVTRNKGDWKYGRFEIRAKLPRGQGIWPAIWLLPTDWLYGGWAASGEIDIMELLGHDPHTVYGTIHYGSKWPENVKSGQSFRLGQSPDFSEAYYTFAFEWDSNSMKWFINDSLYQIQTHWYTRDYPFPAPFNQRFHLLLNIAVGGNWPGYPDASTPFPQKMYVDYVRIYQLNPDYNTRE
jgi:beta-glucanase (GH16 family)